MPKPKKMARMCAWCDKKIPVSRAQRGAKYCSEQCNRARQEWHRPANVERRRKREEANALESVAQRKGKVYAQLEGEGFNAMIYDGMMTASHAAELLGVTPAAVSRAMGAYRVERQRDELAADWEMDPSVAAMLPTDYIDELRDLGMDAEGTDEFDRLVTRIAEAFWIFEHTYFTIGSRGAKMLVKDFHEQIIREFIISFTFGGRALVLTPPRHGKSELVIRFCAWLIVMYPNIQVLWVAANNKLAVAMTRKLKGVFQYSQLKDDFLPPGKRYGDKDAPKWTEDEFILYTRTDHTLKSATFAAIGSTATVAGRDVDFGGIDDLEERKTVVTKELRDKSKEIHAEVMERQEDHTGFVTIGSRQHQDDIPHSLKQQEGDEAWRILEYPAHDEMCVIDPEDMDAHVTCMLMPEVRSYRWLMRQKRESEALGLPGRFPLRYLQKSVPLEGFIFDMNLIKENALDRSRAIGDRSTPSGRLIAGIDPASRGVQAGFLWNYTAEALYCLDLETHDAGGFAGALDLIERWALPPYNCRIFVYEENSQQVEFFRDPRFHALRDKYQLSILPHTTGMNKHDPELGITAMAPMYHSGFINLPYGNEESRRKINLLLSQLELWTADGVAKRGKTDVKMASWFPFPRIQLWMNEDRQIEVEDEHTVTDYPFGSWSDTWAGTMGF